MAQLPRAAGSRAAAADPLGRGTGCPPSRFDLQLAQALGESAFEKSLREKVSQENTSIRWEMGKLQQSLEVRGTYPALLRYSQFGEQLPEQSRDLSNYSRGNQAQTQQLDSNLSQCSSRMCLRYLNNVTLCQQKGSHFLQGVPTPWFS